MSAMFDGSPGTLLASTPGLIVMLSTLLSLVTTTTVMSTTPEKDKTHVGYFVFVFPRKGEKVLDLRKKPPLPSSWSSILRTSSKETTPALFQSPPRVAASFLYKFALHPGNTTECIFFGNAPWISK